MSLLLIASMLSFLFGSLHIYKRHYTLKLTISEARSIGALETEYQWRIEPDSVRTFYGYQLNHIYLYKLTTEADGFRGWDWVEPPVYHMGLEFSLREEGNRIRLQSDSTSVCWWPFVFQFGGGTSCFEGYHPDSNGNREFLFRALETPLRLDFSCIPDYIKLVGRKQDTSKWYPEYLSDDTLFVLHVWRKGLKWPDVKKLAVPNEEQEEVNRRKYQVWLEGEYKRYNDSVALVKDSISKMTKVSKRESVEKVR